MNGTTKKVLLFILLLTVIVSAVLFISKVKKSNKEVTIITTPGNVFSKGTPTPIIISDDFPPLYPGVEWEEPKSGEYIFISQDGETTKAKGFRIESTESVDNETFIKYFTTATKNLNWIETDYASGPNGEAYSCERNGRFFTFGYYLTKSGNRGFIEYN